MSKLLYRMCISIKREHFPDSKRYSDLKNCNIVTLPAHTITFGTPIALVNLLPGDVHVNFTNCNRSLLVPAGERVDVSHVR